MLNAFSEVPLHGQRRVDEERVVVVSVVNEMAAQLPLGADAKMRGAVVPQLRFRQDDELSVAVGLFSAPEVDEAGEGELPVAEVQPPYARQLQAVVGRSVVVALKVALVHQLYGIGLGEVGVVPVPGPADERRLLETAASAQPAVVLGVGCKALLADVQLTGNLRVGGLGELSREVYVDKIVPCPPRIGLELF